MEKDIRHSLQLLEKTPSLLRLFLENLPETLLHSNEGPGTWSPFDVLGHLIHGEKTDWIPRARIILEQGEARAFDPFDREAMFEASKGKSVHGLLDDFEALRRSNLNALRAMDLSPQNLLRKGTHPSLGTVTFGELIATWAVHDLDHLTQILRTTAAQYRAAVGPWHAFLSILTERQ